MKKYIDIFTLYFSTQSPPPLPPAFPKKTQNCEAKKILPNFVVRNKQNSNVGHPLVTMAVIGTFWFYGDHGSHADTLDTGVTMELLGFHDTNGCYDYHYNHRDTLVPFEIPYCHWWRRKCIPIGLPFFAVLTLVSEHLTI